MSGTITNNVSGQNNPIGLPSPSGPIADPKTGLVHPVWYQFFQAFGNVQGTTITNNTTTVGTITPGSGGGAVLTVAVNGQVENSTVDYINFIGQNITGRGSPAPFGATVTLANPEWIDNPDASPVTLYDVGTIALTGDLSLAANGTPTIVQSVVVDNVGNGSVVTLPNTVTLGNFLVCCISSGNSGGLGSGPQPTGFTFFVNAGAFDASTISYLTATSTTNNFTLGGFSTQPSGICTIFEVQGVTGIGAAGQIGSTSVTFGNTYDEQCMYIGICTIEGVTRAPLPDFVNPGQFPAYFGSAGSATGFHNVLGCTVVLPQGNGSVTLSVTPVVASTGAESFAGIQLIGQPPGGNTATIVGKPVITVDGITVLPTNLTLGYAGPSLTTAGIINFGYPNVLGGFLTIENTGTVTNTLASVLNFSGGGVTIAGTAAVESVAIPGVSFSGSNITDILLGNGLSGTVGSGTLLLENDINLILEQGTVVAANPALISLVGAQQLTVSTGAGNASIVQIVQVAAGFGNSSPFNTTATLPNPTVPGNYLVAFLTIGNSFFAFDGSFTTISSGATYWTGAGFKAITLSSQTSCTVQTNTNVVLTLMEINSSSAITSASFTSGTVSFVGVTGQAGNILADGLLLVAFMNGAGGPPVTFSGPMPVGSVILEQAAPNGGFNPASQAIVSYAASAGNSITPEVVYSSVPTGTNAYFALNIGATVPPTATITSEMPLTINGTFEGSYQSTTINTTAASNSASLSGTALVLNLGTSGTGGSMGIIATVGTTSSTYVTLVAGAGETFSGAPPSLTLSTSGTGSSALVIENQGTSIGTAGTLNAGTGATLAVAGGVATVTASQNAFRGAVLQLTSNVTLPGPDQTISWSSILYDTSSFWSAGSATRLTVPAGVGYVRLTGVVYCTPYSAAPGGPYFTKNGSAFVGSGYQIIDNTTAILIEVSSQVVQVVAGDYFELILGGTGTLQGDFHTSFGIEVRG